MQSSHSVLLLQDRLMATEVFQDFLVAALFHVVAVDYKDTLTRLKTHSCCLRACIHTKIMPIMYNDLNQTNESCQTGWFWSKKVVYFTCRQIQTSLDTFYPNVYDVMIAWTMHRVMFVQNNMAMHSLCCTSIHLKWFVGFWMILPFTSGLLTSVFLKNNFGIYIVWFHEETNIHITSPFHKRFFMVENGSSDVQTKKIGSFKNSLKGSLGNQK